MTKRKTEICTLRLTKADKERIKTKAKQAGMTVTDYLVSCGLGKEIRVLDGLHELTVQVKAAGRNLNQLTVLANMGRLNAPSLDELLGLFGDICSALRRLTEEDM
jgi:hypothetical protein